MVWATLLKGLFNSEKGGGIGGLATDLREAIIGKELDPNKKLDLASKMLDLNSKANVIEAQSRSTFVAGWRPFIGWVSGVALGVYFIPQFVLASYLWAKMSLEVNAIVPYPDLDAKDYLFQLILGMLGLGALRTYEKHKGLTN